MWELLGLIERGDEYYEIYDETRQHPSPFAKLFQKCDICVQYPMPDIP